MLNLFYKLLPSSCSDILERGSCVTVPYAHCVVHIIELCVCVCVSEEDNVQGWFFAEDDGNQMKKQKHPLLLRQMPVVMSKLQEFKVRHFVFFPLRSSAQRLGGSVGSSCVTMMPHNCGRCSSQVPQATLK